MAKYDTKLQEEELKLHVAEDFFAAYDCKRKIGKIDFCVDIPATELGLYDSVSALWAESKSGTHRDVRESFVQLILTIGRAKINQQNHPPFFLGAFDAEKIAFLPYDAVMDVFAQNDFNWNVTPSDHATKEFAQLYEIARKTLEEKSLVFNYEADEQELRRFIKSNFVTGRRDVSRIQITRNNFTHVYQKWRVEVMPTLDVENWDSLRKSGIIDADFFLADILSENNKTLRKKLFVLLQSDIYEVKYGRADNGLELWRYYHAQPHANPNASYYDIRAHFQGRKPNGTMNATSDDAKYNELLDALKKAHKRLAAQIAPKVYAYGFLRA